MKVSLIGPEETEWSEVLATTRHDVYHLPGYVSTAAIQDGGRAVALLVDGGSKGRLLVPLVLRSIPGGLLDATSPYGYPGPLVGGDPAPGFVDVAMQRGLDYLHARSIVSLFVRLHPIITIDRPERFGSVVSHGDAIIVDLSLSEDELWRQTRANHRRDVNRSRRAGHHFSFETSDGSYDAFVRLYRDTMRRHSAADYYMFEDGYFEALRSALGERLHLAIVRIDGVIAAAALFTSVCGIVQLHLTGWDDNLAKYRPTKFLYHHVRSWARERGDRWLCLGGGHGSEGDGLLHFKLGFSPYTRPYLTLRVVLDDAAYHHLVGETGVAYDVDDPSGYFPAYRLPPGIASDSR